MKCKRFLALILCAALLFSQLGLVAHAQGTSAVIAGGLCEHHPAHTAECGYIEAVEGGVCGHICEICNIKDSGAEGTDEKSDTKKNGDENALPEQTAAETIINTAFYDSGDVAVINAIIENNGLSAAKDAPEAWGTADIVLWNEESPKRITGLGLYSKNLRGTLDVSDLNALTGLGCGNNQLTELNVSGLENLKELYCYNNQLTKLDLSGLTQLIALDCGDNQLTNLDLSGLAGLKRLSCSGNQLTELDLSSLMELEWLECEGCGLTALDVSGLAKLSTLRCDDNPLASFKLADDKMLTVGSVAGGTVTLTSYDHGEESVTLTAVPKTGYSFKNWTASGTVLADAAANPVSFAVNANISIAPVYSGDSYDSGDVAVINTIIENNGLSVAKDSPEDWGTAGIVTWNDESPKRITELDLFYYSHKISGTLDVSGLTRLTKLDCTFCSLTELNLSGLTGLTELYCGENQLTELDVSKLTSLDSLDCSTNQLTKLDVSGLTSLTYLQCNENQLTELNVSRLSNLTVLGISANRFTELNLSGLTGLTELWCGENQLTELDVSKLTSLDRLGCSTNQLTKLDVSGLTSLTYLECYDNQLTKLNVSGLKSLTHLECQYNRLTELDVSGLKSLTYLLCDENQLTELDVSSLTNLILLMCNDNQLTELDMSGLTSLTYLQCNDNQLTELDVSGQSDTPGLYCHNNPLASLKLTRDEELTVGSAAGGTVMLTGYDHETKSATLKAIPSVNYSFKNWTASGTVLADAAANPVSFAVNANISIAPVYTYYRGGGSGGGGSSDDSFGSTPTITTPASTDNDPSPAAVAQTSVEAKTDQNGNASVTVAEKNITDAIKAAQDAAKKAGSEKNGIAVVVDVKTDTTATSLSTTLPLNAVDTLIKTNVTSVSIQSATASVTLDLTALKTAQATAKGAITVSVAKKNVSGLSAAAQKAIGNRPVFRFTLQSGGKPVTDFGGGTASIAVPYAPPKVEDAGKLCMVYVDDLGGATFLTNSSYDPNTKSMLGRTGHFSVYGVGYKADVPMFTDTTNHWARIDIDFVAARGLLSGTGNNRFSPDTGVTRGAFVTALGRLAGIDPAQYKNTKFTDVAATAAFAPYVAWATEKGIVDGATTTTFAPETSISREQMAVIMANYAKATGYTVPKTREAVTFADNGSIASWAKNAVKAMQMAGVMAGKDSKKFDPQETATRAEAAAVLHRYVDLVIDPATAQGWTQNDSGSKMYYKNGKVLSGWWQIGGKWYYFYSTGVMATNTKIDGYTIGSDGLRTGKQ